MLVTPQQSKSTMPKQKGEEPAQRSKSLIKLCLLGALKRKNLLAMVIYNYVIKGNGVKAI